MMTDRDHFAAAALTGLLAQGDDGSFSEESYVRGAYRWADAMLRERGKLSASDSTAHEGDSCRGGGDCPVPENAANLDAGPAAIVPEPEPSAARRRPAGGTGGTDHGAAPAARASVGRPRTDNADLPTRAGTGDTPVAESATTAEPVAWGVANGKGLLATSISRIDAVDMQGDYAYHTEIVPLYRHPPVTKPMPKEKRAEVCAGPLAWAAIRENGQPLWLSYDRSGAEGMVNGMAEVVPLYRKPTLTDAEAETLRELRDEAAQYADEIGLCASEVRGRQRIIDGLLERLGGGR